MAIIIVIVSDIPDVLHDVFSPVVHTNYLFLLK